MASWIGTAWGAVKGSGFGKWMARSGAAWTSISADIGAATEKIEAAAEQEAIWKTRFTLVTQTGNHQIRQKRYKTILRETGVEIPPKTTKGKRTSLRAVAEKAANSAGEQIRLEAAVDYVNSVKTNTRSAVANKLGITPKIPSDLLPDFGDPNINKAVKMTAETQLAGGRQSKGFGGWLVNTLMGGQTFNKSSAEFFDEQVFKVAEKMGIKQGDITADHIKSWIKEEKVSTARANMSSLWSNISGTGVRELKSTKEMFPMMHKGIQSGEGWKQADLFKPVGLGRVWGRRAAWTGLVAGGVTVSAGMRIMHEEETMPYTGAMNLIGTPPPAPDPQITLDAYRNRIAF